MDSPNPWPLTFALVVALAVFGGGTMAAIVLGRPVPSELWPIDGGLVTAVVAHAGFTTLRASGAQAMGHLADIAHANLGTGTTPTNGTTIPGDHSAASQAVHSGGSQ